MLIKRRANIKASEITDERLFKQRRLLMQGAGSIAAAAALGANGLWMPRSAQALTTDPEATGNMLESVADSMYKVDEKITPFNDITSYNNFYEFGTGKRDPSKRAKAFKTKPWTIKVSGACDKPGDYALEDFLKPYTLEERVYRFRCVEAWSMVVPWVGIPLGPVLKQFAPTSDAKYVAFKTLFDPKQMPGQKSFVLEWPYVEGLRIDEAMHPLSFLATGLYGRELPNQNGAPIRLVLPWKYGFKSIKSIVHISFSANQPPTSWNRSASREYGFYSNVNPNKSHPRWSQSRERRIGEIFKRDTLMFNGYADDVGSLYAGMDLKKHF